jgi:hypothetical protein
LTCASRPHSLEQENSRECGSHHYESQKLVHPIRAPTRVHQLRHDTHLPRQPDKVRPEHQRGSRENAQTEQGATHATGDRNAGQAGSNDTHYADLMRSAGTGNGTSDFPWGLSMSKYISRQTPRQSLCRTEKLYSKINSLITAFISTQSVDVNNPDADFRP